MGTGRLVAEQRFAFSLLQKVTGYVEKTFIHMSSFRASEKTSFHVDFIELKTDVKFFIKAVLPFLESFFRANRTFFLNPTSNPFAASLKEKELVAILFCKLTYLTRQKFFAFGQDISIVVRCLQFLIQCIDVKSVVSTNVEFVRANLQPFFVNTSEDLHSLLGHLEQAQSVRMKSSNTQRAAYSLNYALMVLIPLLGTFFDHLASNEFGADILLGDIQHACYKILDCLYRIGTTYAAPQHEEAIFLELARHRPVIGECIASFAACFPVAFLEPEYTSRNRNSLFYQPHGGRESFFSSGSSSSLAPEATGIPEFIHNLPLFCIILSSHITSRNPIPHEYEYEFIRCEAMHDQVASNLESLEALSNKIQRLAEESAARFQHKIHQYTDHASEHAVSEEAQILFDIILPMLCRSSL